MSKELQQQHRYESIKPNTNKRILSHVSELKEKKRKKDKEMTRKRMTKCDRRHKERVKER